MYPQAQEAQVQQVPPRPAPGNEIELDRALAEIERDLDQRRLRLEREQQAQMRAAENALLNIGLNIDQNDQVNRVQVNVNGTGRWRR
jgi:hypothetical protein